jgi:glycosyltransferase involved in cell wall biosynthesis
LCDVFTSPIEVGQGYKWIAYTPIDTVEATSAITRRLTNAYFVPCVTHYTEQIIKEAVPQVRTSYCPHCVDTSKYYIKNKKECKEKLNFTEDDYVFGMIAMNKGVIPRKSFPQILEAFAKIHKKYPQTKMYLHTITDRAMQDSVDINMILNENGILSAARRADPFRILIGYSDEDMCVIYNALDCMILCSLGEGFGIPLIEAQACGTPVLTQDYGPQAELCKVGWKVKAGPDYWTHLCGHWKMPLVDDIYDKMEQAINSHITERTRKEARKAIVEEYDCNVVYKKSWKPLFEQLEKELHD